jgi:2-dehydropantoate 2-reductase
MRYIVLGAGGVGSAIGGLLSLAGAEVVLVARVAHLEALTSKGLLLSLPSRDLRVEVHAVASPGAVRFGGEDVVLSCTKSQDTEAALRDLAAVAPRALPIVCAQNGVAAERIAARMFSRVLGLVVFSPIEHTTPGVVSVHGSPSLGGLELGVHPRGSDDLTRAIVRDLAKAGFDAREEARIQRWKYGKLLMNVGNAVQALARDAPHDAPLLARLSAEAEACYAAAGIEHATLAELLARYAGVGSVAAGGRQRGGGSTWQSLARGTGSIETDALNGEIVRLGEAHGVPTPANRAVTDLARRASEERWPPGRLTVREIEAAIGTS